MTLVLRQHSVTSLTITWPDVLDQLSRFDKAGAYTKTSQIGYKICGQFNIPATVRVRLLDTTIGRLHGVSACGGALCFGFGAGCSAQLLCKIKPGATCVALCACLSVSYDTFFSSQVFKALAE
jgi:hypothetical protein